MDDALEFLKMISYDRLAHVREENGANLREQTATRLCALYHGVHPAQGAAVLAAS